MKIILIFIFQILIENSKLTVGKSRAIDYIYSAVSAAGASSAAGAVSSVAGSASAVAGSSATGAGSACSALADS